MKHVILLRNGLISHNMTDAMGFCPPLIIGSKEVANILEITRQSLDELASEVGSASLAERF